ncbi:MAG: ATP-binding protein [Gemmatimonadales bacterium]
MKRIYEQLIEEHFRDNRQMFFLMGSRQVGKTTTARESAAKVGEVTYLNWDNGDDRQRILSGPAAVAEDLGLDRLRDTLPMCVFDELHKFGRWKGFLKGLFDTYGERAHLLVTGSARLDVFRAGGDSLMGRYFPYRMHPISVAELVSQKVEDGLIRPPSRVNDDLFLALLRFGGYPEPFHRQTDRFWRRWSRLRGQQLFREDLRDLTQIRELGQVEILARLIRQQTGQLTSYSSLSRAVGASVDTVKRWIGTLESLYYCYCIRPWHKNVARSLRKEPKYFLWDWSQAPSEGARGKNLVASALLKAAHLWTDRGDGEFGLFFLRDKEKHEVDFVVVRDGVPWFLVEVKRSGGTKLSPELGRFQQQTGASHAFQLTLDLEYVDRDCFEYHEPLIVPARTLLSQLV